jgi:hypothetical protein
VKRLLAVLLGVAFLAFLTAPAPGCFVGYDPASFARRCPIIVTGTIARIDEDDSASDRPEDTAHIWISAVHKDMLLDHPLQRGGVILAKMSSARRHTRSTDLSYPLETKAVWLLELRPDGTFCINTNPVQCQPVEKEAELRRDGVFDSREEMRIIRGRGPTNAIYTQAGWLARIKRGQEGKAERKQTERLEDGD